MAMLGAGGVLLPGEEGDGDASVLAVLRNTGMRYPRDRPPLPRYHIRTPGAGLDEE